MGGDVERVAPSTIDCPPVLIDWLESSGYRVVIYSPSDQPVTASAGVLLFEGGS
jgi:hypothetical protein